MKLLPLALAFPALLLASGCGSAKEPSTPVGANTVRMTEYEFDPSRLTVRHGTAITVTNVGEIAHNLTVERGPDPREQSTELAGTSSFLPGRSKELKLELAAGRYVMVCTVPGHRQLGMVGTLIVK
jgi:plastocyanin